MSGQVQEAYSGAVAVTTAVLFSSPTVPSSAPLPNGIARNLFVQSTLTSGAILTLPNKLLGNKAASTSGTTTTLVDASLTQAASYWVGKQIRFTSGANRGLIKDITVFSGGTITWAGAITATLEGDTYEILDTVVVGNHTLGTYIKIPCIMATFAAGTLLALA